MSQIDEYTLQQCIEAVCEDCANGFEVLDEGGVLSHNDGDVVWTCRAVELHNLKSEISPAPTPSEETRSANDCETGAGDSGCCADMMNSTAVAREPVEPFFAYGQSRLFQDDSFDWLTSCAPQSIHGVVTDPPYGVVEYTKKEQAKLRKGRGGVWRIPPAFDGHQRSPLPRFTTLSERDLKVLEDFFGTWARTLLPALVPGAHVVIASNPLLSHRIAGVVERVGFERRGEIIRLVMTLRGGDRPKNAHDEFRDVSVMPRSMWEPWLLFRKKVEGRVQDNLRKWGTGGLRRPDNGKPFGDVIESHPTRKLEKEIAPHPSLKPQSFMRQMVRAILPMGEGIVLDPFAGSGSTLAAAEAVGYASIGIEKDKKYARLARKAIPKLAALTVNGPRHSGRMGTSNE